jgi:nicotinamide-nucleotide amidase
MTAAILSIGTELTRGELVNGNAAWLAEQLTALGFTVLEHATVDDDLGRVVAALHRLTGVARVVVCTGGLGPTTDDLTTEAAARAAGVGLVRDEASLEAIRRRFAQFQREMPRSNEKQADFPAGAVILPNATGTAPGFELALRAPGAQAEAAIAGAAPVEREPARFFFMPGVPAEMRRMFSEGVVPRIAALAARDTHQIHLRTFGLTESQVGELLTGIEQAEPRVTIGYRAHFPEIEVKVHARGASTADAEETSRRVAALVEARLADVVFGGRDDTYPLVVGRALREAGLTLAVAESCTGGLVGSMLTSVPGASDYLLFDAVTYANAAKESVLGVSPDTLRAHGAVSEEVAAEMAEGALRVAGSDLAVAITGIAGPGGGSPEKPVGTVCFALARRGAEVFTHRRRLPGDRDRIRTLAAYVALRLVLRAARGQAGV